MVSAIILLLALLTAGLVVGVFLIALFELKQIDKMAADHGTDGDKLPAQVATGSTNQA